MDIATESMMGSSTGMLSRGQNYHKNQMFVDDYKTCLLEVVRKAQVGPLQYFMSNAEAESAKQRMWRHVDDFIDRALRSHESAVEYNVLHKLLAMRSDRKALRDQVLHILLAGRDTTASLLSNLFFVLAKQPAAYEKLRADVLSVAGSDVPTPSQVKDMTYLKWCIQECESIHLDRCYGVPM
jgi:cytochrome P450